MTVERDTLEMDVLLVGAGPANLACALHLKNLIKTHNERVKKRGGKEIGDIEIAIIEKAAEIGAHQLSGAVLDPRSLRELIPDFERDAPLEAPPLPEERRAVPIERPRVTLGYTSAERDQWLPQCQERTRDLTICEDYLGRYEQAVYGSGRVQGPAGCASPTGPVTWVRVPIVRQVPPQR